MKSVTKTPPNPAPSIGVSDAAQILHTHANTVLNLAGSGRLRGAKLGKRWVFSEADVYAYRDAEIARQTRNRRAAYLPQPSGQRASSEIGVP